MAQQVELSSQFLKRIPSSFEPVNFAKTPRVAEVINASWQPL